MLAQHLCADLADGSTVVSEVAVRGTGKARIVQLRTLHAASAFVGAMEGARLRAPTCVLVRVRELAGLSCCVGTYVYPCTGTYS